MIDYYGDFVDNSVDVYNTKKTVFDVVIKEEDIDDLKQDLLEFADTYYDNEVYYTCYVDVKFKELDSDALDIVNMFEDIEEDEDDPLTVDKVIENYYTHYDVIVEHSDLLDPSLFREVIAKYAYKGIVD